MYVAAVLTVLASTILCDFNTPPKEQGTAVCRDCQLVVDTVQTALLNPFFDLGAERFLEFAVCSKVPVYAETCADFVRVFVPEIFRYISNKIKPVKVCDQVNLCSIPQTQYFGKFGGTDYQINPIEKEQLINGIQLINSNENKELLGQLTIQDLACSYCMYHTQELYDGQTCEKTCENFPLKDQCTRFCQIDLVPAVQQFDTAAEVCTQLSVCASNSVNPTPAPLQNNYQKLEFVQNPKLNNESCLFCEAIVVEIKVYMLTQEDRIREVLNLLCDSLLFDNGNCRMVVDKYLSNIFNVIEGYLNPVTVCTDLDQCPEQLRIS
eukprot:TRINITY_DN919_c1_g3_i1.p1 TRINITY_DN919_c1_g3~~TRINITY_DN919_c1_g3_i1.p1  ORF type:complete len:358 (-),score=44.09 TRINITY_DN919_c1_g3_i1:378-1343(-)